MKTSLMLKSVWILLEKAERKRAVMLGLCLVGGTILEVLSVGALVPLIQVLTQSNLQSKYPLIDQVFPDSSDQFIVAIILVCVIGVFLIKEIYLVFSLWMQRGFIARLETRFQTELFDRYTRQMYEFHLTNNSSILSRNILNSTNFMNNVLDPIMMLMTDGLVTIAICVALIVIEPVAMFVTICSVGAVASLFHGFSKRRVEQWGTERQIQDGMKLQQMNETFGGIKEILVTGRGDFFRTQFLSNVRNLSVVNQKFMTLLGIPRLYLELLSIFGIAALVLTMLALGRSSESLIPLLTLFAGGAFRLMPGVNRITLAFQSLRMGRPIINILHSDLESASRNDVLLASGNRIQFHDSICFEDVSYTYPNTDRHVIDGVSFRIKKGSQVGIVGSTGAGKSTLVDILLGLISPSGGKVTVDSADISTNIRSWQDLVGYVPQSIYLIDSSIRSNVAFGVEKKDVDEERVLTSLKLAQLDEFVDELPDGINEQVGERGVRLSGGQRQRIGIARALYSDPPILIFDEATSALDVETEKEVMKSLDGFRASKTIFIVTHRLTALDQCDLILAIENGRLIAS